MKVHSPTYSYPARKPYFANSFCRLLQRARVANEIGADACWLLTVIAHTEDGTRYVGPVTYFNNQLMEVCGLNSHGRLQRVRQRAIDTGWLAYVPGGKGKAGQYYCTIPAEYAGVNDSRANASTDECTPEMDSQIGSANGSQSSETNNADACASKLEAHPERIRSTNAHPSTLHPNPKPRPERESAGADPPETARGGVEPEPPNESRTVPHRESVSHVGQHVVDAWNALGEPFPMIRSVTGDRRSKLKSRLANPEWCDQWRDALAKLPASRFLRGDNDRGWRADFDWFLKLGSVNAIIEGKYDDHSPNGRQTCQVPSAFRYGDDNDAV